MLRLGGQDGPSIFQWVPPPPKKMRARPLIFDPSGSKFGWTSRVQERHPTLGRNFLNHGQQKKFLALNDDDVDLAQSRGIFEKRGT